MHNTIAAIRESYRAAYNFLGMFLGVFGVLLSILAVIFVTHPGWLIEIGAMSLGVLCAALLAPAGIGLVRSFSGDDALAPPDQVRDFMAISYAATSDADMRELTRFAMKQFGETFPAEVDAGAVRNGSALGLRLADEKGRNIGFLDVYHFRDDALAAWRQGDLDEKTMTLDQFAPIAAMPAQSTVNLVLGALYIDTSNPVATYHLAAGLIEAAKDYLKFALREFAAVNVHASIFSSAGRRWAAKEGFVPDIVGAKRGRHGGGHDVYLLTFKPGGPSPRDSFSIYGSNCEYRIRLRLQ